MIKNLANRLPANRVLAQQSQPKKASTRFEAKTTDGDVFQRSSEKAEFGPEGANRLNTIVAGLYEAYGDLLPNVA